ncbi:paired immunoglobulin-like type 2 receptor alpha isoform X3 [Mustela putorius furo]|uniref:paired immunoglobulin-like type 2 receptor alpha isoform X3 n=1 Tax=Mustela putorius furo TaxID=9669 RepID=UPI001D19D119|nr:paired immunoglobulin-like type 2 receptor alpha isoform X3 [Mustela putorius furo]
MALCALTTRKHFCNIRKEETRLIKKVLVTLETGRSAKCDTTNYGINQPDRLSAPEGGSVRIPFSFYHDLELAPDPRVSVALTRTHFHGPVIYNSTQPFIHKDYRNRISLELPKGQRSGSLQIWNLQEKDGNLYFYRIQVETLRCGTKVWQALNGTKVTITPALEMTTTAPTTDAPMITAPSSGALEGNWSSAPSMGVGPMVIVTLADIVLKIAILGLILYLRWKRSKG